MRGRSVAYWVFAMLCCIHLEGYGQTSGEVVHTVLHPRTVIGKAPFGGTCHVGSARPEWDNIRKPGMTHSCYDPPLPKGTDLATWNMDSQEIKKIGSDSKTSTAIDPVIGTNFRGNEFKFISTPPDNSIAISNDGFIVSIDNETIEFYDDNGNNLLQHKSLFDFINDASLNSVLFDPNVIYDPYNDRFIFVLMHGGNSQTSKILLNISRSGDPRDGWYRYLLPGDTLHSNSWSDYPFLAVNQHEIFVSVNIVQDSSTGGPDSTNVFQIRKREVYDSLPNLVFRVWPDLRTPSGTPGFGLVPLSDGLGDSQENGIWLVSNQYNGGDKVFVYHVDDTLAAPGVSVTSSMIATSSYGLSSLVDQPGTTNQLQPRNCKIRGGFIQDSMIHYVFHFDIGLGYTGISYNRIDLRTYSNHRNTWGNSGVADYAYPSIASYGVSKADRSVMVGFLRAGLTIFPEVCVVNYDGTNWSPGGTRVIKAGEDYIDLQPDSVHGNLERWGDYTAFARKYNSPYRSLWMIGSYGVNTNFWGGLHGYNAWIAEIRDTVANSIEEWHNISSTNPVQLAPNPASEWCEINLRLDKSKDIEIDLINLAGKKVKERIQRNSQSGTYILRIEVDALPSGTYFVIVKENQEITFREKLIVHH